TRSKRDWSSDVCSSDLYIALSCAGGNWITAETEAPEEAISDLAWKKHQMPAWHLITADGQGITLVNIGVGPSNAKTICDHLAVRSEERRVGKECRARSA